MRSFVSSWHEGVDVLKLAVNGGKAHVGDLVHVLEALHDHLADLLGRDLALERALQLLLDLVGDLLQHRQRHLALVAGTHHSVDELALIKALTAARRA